MSAAPVQAAPVPLLGMGLACALGTDLAQCTNTLRLAERHLTRARLEQLTDPIDCAFHRIADGADLFDPGRLSRLLSQVVTAALDDACLSQAQRRTMPILVGSSCFSLLASEPDYRQALATDATHALPMPQADYAELARQARQICGSRAADIAFNTACTSSANALLAAHRMLITGQARHVLVLGVELANRTSMAGFAGLQLLADEVRPFAIDRAGIVLGEAVAAVVLGTTEPNNIQDHDAPLLRGGASSTDTHALTTAHPDGRGLAAVQRQALQACGARATDIRAIKAHATSTPSNDEAEARALQEIHDPLPPVTALKPWIGHTLGACGAAELALLAASLQRGFLPATGHATVPDPALGLVPLQTVLPSSPGLYQLNHFGFGGSNNVLLMEMP